MSIVLKPGLASGSIWNPADLMLEPNRLKKKQEKKKFG
jgi:hypothetical protein